MAAQDVISVNGKDRLGCAFVTSGNSEVVLVTRMGRSIRFSEDQVRAMGTAARGVAGINLKRGDEVVAALPVVPGGELLTVTSAGYVKRTSMNEFSPQGRGGGGIIAHKLGKTHRRPGGRRHVDAGACIRGFRDAKGRGKAAWIGRNSIQWTQHVGLAQGGLGQQRRGNCCAGGLTRRGGHGKPSAFARPTAEWQGGHRGRVFGKR